MDTPLDASCWLLPPEPAPDLWPDLCQDFLIEYTCAHQCLILKKWEEDVAQQHTVNKHQVVAAYQHLLDEQVHQEKAMWARALTNECCHQAAQIEQAADEQCRHGHKLAKCAAASTEIALATMRLWAEQDKQCCQHELAKHAAAEQAAND